jgi:hypothetical protein
VRQETRAARELKEEMRAINARPGEPLHNVVTHRRIRQPGQAVDE